MEWFHREETSVSRSLLVKDIEKDRRRKLKEWKDVWKIHGKTVYLIRRKDQQMQAEMRQ